MNNNFTNNASGNYGAPNNNAQNKGGYGQARTHF